VVRQYVHDAYHERSEGGQAAGDNANRWLDRGPDEDVTFRPANVRGSDETCDSDNAVEGCKAHTVIVSSPDLDSGRERGIQATKQEHKTDCDLLTPRHLQLKNPRDRNHKYAYIAEKVDNTNTKIELEACEQAQQFGQRRADLCFVYQDHTLRAIPLIPVV
jgi:hypothetical protein